MLYKMVLFLKRAFLDRNLGFFGGKYLDGAPVPCSILHTR